ncbi:hypothetical protein CERZMDRAFT_88918 [Cercospora zeae-maydis SCOH1-5]|uniref:Uncharacterized protein n=1 Tax=Cercospora zeae-maydis SCOH1-5 TaxID=717836 RepID=A0A6A6F314_9PEZI|nr:hypothetical protein CERZMDRAFT_88918 [Cercospora zeae-maydis SCOH1-5]
MDIRALIPDTNPRGRVQRKADDFSENLLYGIHYPLDLTTINFHPAAASLNSTGSPRQTEQNAEPENDRHPTTRGHESDSFRIPPTSPTNDPAIPSQLSPRSDIRYKMAIAEARLESSNAQYIHLLMEAFRTPESARQDLSRGKNELDALMIRLELTSRNDKMLVAETNDRAEGRKAGCVNASL